MGESLKSIFAVVVSHAAFTKSTERKTVCRKVTDYIVNDGTLEDLDKEIMEKVIKKIWKN